MTVTKVDVFISGAGPVGLFFAYQMAMRGHSIYICDFKNGPTLESRAASVTARSMEIFEARGLAGDFIAESFAAKGIRVWRNGKILGQVDYGGDTAYGQLTVISQSNTESILNRRLESDTDSRVHWETELVSYTQDKDKVVSIVLDKKTGEKHQIESTYIVGADGSRSKVRKGNDDWSFDGVADNTKFALADLELRGEGIEEFNDRLNLMSSGPDIFGMVRLNPLPHEGVNDFNTFRLFGNLTAYRPSENKNSKEVTHGFVDKEKDTPTLTLDFIQTWLNKFTGSFKFTAGNLLWVSEFRVNERIVNGYRRDRAFLMGDAAHCHSPAGGFGMSLGLQDADNLAWKMSDALKGVSSDPEKLLDSYSLERFPVAKATIKTTGNANAASFSRSEIAGYVFTIAAFTALKIPQVRTMAFKNAMQLDVALDPKASPILGKFDKGLLKPGQFLPNHDPLRRTIYPNASSSRNRFVVQRQTLRDILVLTDKTTVVFIGTRPPSTVSNQNIIEKLWKETRNLPVKRIIIQSTWNSRLSLHPSFILEEEKSIAEESFYNEERIDSPLSLTNQIGLLPFLSPKLTTERNPPGVLLVVRPDYYISQAQLIHDEKELMSSLAYVQDMFVKNEGTVSPAN